VTDPVVAVITGGRNRQPTIVELEDALARLRDPAARLAARSVGKVEIVRHGDCRGIDKAVAAWLKARTGDEFKIEAWPAEIFGTWPRCGPKRNRAMLDGAWPDSGTLFGEASRPRASFLVAFRGGVGTANCCSAALGERWLPIEWIPDVDEPRPWNRHHGPPPEPSVYVGRARDPRRSSPLANPWPLELEPGQARADAAAANLERYKRWLWSRLKPGGSDHDPRVLEALDQIGPEHHLICSCWPRRCHAEVIVAAWRWRREQVAPSRGSNRA
jgi:hypothetical protein